MAANLITYADGVVSPFLDGIMQELYTSGGGVITGGTITISGASTLHITQTHGALCGREFSIDDGDYSVPLSSSGTKLGRIYLHMDLANTAVPLEVLIETGSTLTPVVQDDDVNETDGTYEINLATFEVDESTIKNLTNVAPTIKTMLERTLQTLADCALSTDPQDVAGAAALNALNSNIAKMYLDGTNYNFIGSSVSYGSSYTAPATGIYFIKVSSSSTQGAGIYYDSALTKGIINISASGGQQTATIPLKQGATIYTANNNTTGYYVYGYIG